MQSPSLSQPRLYIVGYARAYRRELCAAFSEQGFAVSMHETPELAALALGQGCPDAVLMDWLPVAPLSSHAFVERYGGLMPVLILTRRSALIDVVRALRAGAADFIRLPCYFPEILARVERSRADVPVRRQLKVGNLSLDVESGVARIGRDKVRMTTREARMLSAMIRCPEHPVSRDALLRVAGITGAKSTIIESYMKQLRKRHPKLRRAIRTRYGQGYAFCPER